MKSFRLPSCFPEVLGALFWWSQGHLWTSNFGPSLLSQEVVPPSPGLILDALASHPLPAQRLVEPLFSFQECSWSDNPGSWDSRPPRG